VKDLTESPSSASPRALTLICWEFTRRDERLICQVDNDQESGAFGVAMVPFPSAQRSWRETFRAAAAAFGRHAALASHLRASGWKLTGYTS
jgi:hypothetical protein